MSIVMIREIIAQQVRAIEPHDELEASHKQAALAWIASGADLFRTKKPDVPLQHLVAYFAVVDPKRQSMLLQDHLLAKAWVPPGGHVDPDEDPITTVERECEEELGLRARFLGQPKPLFVTITRTVPPGVHSDVSLWYVLQADESTPLTLEKNKFAAVQWWQIDNILRTEVTQFDPHLHRFCIKLRAITNSHDTDK